MQRPETIPIASTMSSDKSALKTKIMREPPFSAALTLVTSNPYALAPPGPDAGDAITCVVEDGSIRFAAGPGGAFAASGVTGRAFAEQFWRAMRRAFDTLPQLHTYVLVFDKKQYVPREKASTQASRQTALAASVQRSQSSSRPSSGDSGNNTSTTKKSTVAGGGGGGDARIAAWTWDGVSDVVTADDVMPPWSQMRLSSKAYSRALVNVVQLVLDQCAPPAGRRVIIDCGEPRDGCCPVVVETDAAGVVRVPYTDATLRNTIGEADMAAQWYAGLARAGWPAAAAELPARLAAGPRPVVVPPAFASYYTSEAYVAAPTPEPGVLRDTFATGPVVLLSPDTDYLPLSMLHFNQVQSPHNVYLSMGKCYVLPQNEGADSATMPRTWCTKNAANAVAASELYSVRELCAAVTSLHAAATVPSFVALCMACGNDYVKRRSWLTHKHMLAGYTSAPLQAAPGPATGTLTIDSQAFRTWLRASYWHRQPAKRQRSGAASFPMAQTWDEAVKLVASTVKRADARMPSEEELAAYLRDIAWALAYAQHGPYGFEHVPRKQDME